MKKRRRRMNIRQRDYRQTVFLPDARPLFWWVKKFKNIYQSRIFVCYQNWKFFMYAKFSFETV
jgi:hypothetical protein